MAWRLFSRMPRSAAKFDSYTGVNASLSSSDRVERFEEGREPGLDPGVPGRDLRARACLACPASWSLSGSLSTCADISDRCECTNAAHAVDSRWRGDLGRRPRLLDEERDGRQTRAHLLHHVLGLHPR